MGDLQDDASQQVRMHYRKKMSRLVMSLFSLNHYVARHERRQPKLHWLCVTLALAVATLRNAARPVVLLYTLIGFFGSAMFRVHQPADKEGGRSN